MDTLIPDPGTLALLLILALTLPIPARFFGISDQDDVDELHGGDHGDQRRPRPPHNWEWE